MKFTRREFVSVLAAAPLAGAPEQPRMIVEGFGLDRVKLLDGPFRAAMEKNREYLRALEANRMLLMFRKTAGIAASAKPLGGWERPDCELRGHFLGHYLSGCAMTAANLGDGALKDKASAIVAELAKCQQKMGTGYLSAFPVEFFERLKAGGKVWAPWYTIHKIMAGLLDMYTFCGDKLALEVLERQAAWVKSWTGQMSEEQMQRTLEVEHGGMVDVLLGLSVATKNQAWAELARRFEHKKFLERIGEAGEPLMGLHANTQIPKVIGAALQYELEGDPHYARLIQAFWRTVALHRSYCTGGTSNDEHWRTGADQLAGQLSASTQECCCTYNMLKLTRYVIRWTLSNAAADYYERALLNGVLGTMNPRDGMTMYYVPLASGYWKTFGTPDRSFWCCTGTGVESFSKFADSIYFRGVSSNSLYINLFIASELDWQEKGVHIRQETAFPDDGAVKLTISTKQPVRFALRVRRPGWLTSAMSLKINGVRKRDSDEFGPHWTVNRMWNDGDIVEINLPMALRAEEAPDDRATKAFFYGPLVLAGELGTAGIAEQMKQANPGEPSLAQEKWAKPVPAPELVLKDRELTGWIHPVEGRKQTFRTIGQKQDITLSPFNKLFDQRYGVYWKTRRFWE